MKAQRVIPVTLILTTLNEKNNIALFFDGVRHGSVLPAEISICDGGSNDGSWELLAAEKIPGVRILCCRVNGANIAAGRNEAIRRATEEVLAVTDAGCAIDEFWLERISQPLLDSPDADAVAGGYAYAGESFFQRANIASALPPEAIPPENFLPSSRSFAVRKSSILRAGAYAEHMTFAGEDTALCLRMLEMNMRFVRRLDAQVSWFVRDSVRGFVRQQFMYGLGDGEARSHNTSYFKHILRHALLITLLFGALVYPVILGVVAALLIMHFVRLHRVYDWGKQPVRIRIAAYGLVLLKITVLTAGWIRGRLFGPPGRRRSE